MSFELIDNLFQVVVLILAALLASFLTVRYRERRFLILAMAYSCFAMGTLYWVLHIAITGDIPRVFYVAEISWVASYFFYFSIRILRQGEEHQEFRFAVLPALAMAVVCGIVLYLHFVGVLSGIFAVATGGIVYLSLLRLKQKAPHPEMDVCFLLCILLQLGVYLSSYFMADFTRFNLYFALDMALSCSFVALLPLTMQGVKER